MKSHHKGRHHARGGKIGGREHEIVSGNPDVLREAEKKGEGGSRKHGGRKMHHRVHGGRAHHRHDRPGRRMGGRVGADKAPLSSAHHGSHPGGTLPKSEDSYGGERPD
jgi:hypothetical protein